MFSIVRRTKCLQFLDAIAVGQLNPDDTISKVDGNEAISLNSNC